MQRRHRAWVARLLATLSKEIEAWDESFAINVTAVRTLTQALLPAMIERRWAKGLSREMGPHGITVNGVAPDRVSASTWTAACLTPSSVRSARSR